MAKKTVKISEVIGSGYGGSANDGKHVYETIVDHITKGDRVAISFESTIRLTAAFLNAAVEQLYGEFTHDKIKKFLAPLLHADPWQLNRLKVVVDRAKVFFDSPDSVTEISANESGMPNA